MMNKSSFSFDYTSYDSVYNEIIFLKNTINNTIDTSTYTTGKYVLNLDIIDFSSSILNKSDNMISSLRQGIVSYSTISNSNSFKKLKSFIKAFL